MSAASQMRRAEGDGGRSVAGEVPGEIVASGLWRLLALVPGRKPQGPAAGRPDAFARLLGSSLRTFDLLARTRRQLVSAHSSTLVDGL